MIGTSKTRDNTGFELFITTAPIPDLNDKLLVFGRAIKGEDVVQVQSMFFTSDLFLCLLAASFFSNLFICNVPSGNWRGGHRWTLSSQVSSRDHWRDTETRNLSSINWVRHKVFASAVAALWDTDYLTFLSRFSRCYAISLHTSISTFTVQASFDNLQVFFVRGCRMA